MKLTHKLVLGCLLLATFLPARASTIVIALTNWDQDAPLLTNTVKITQVGPIRSDGTYGYIGIPRFDTGATNGFYTNHLNQGNYEAQIVWSSTELAVEGFIPPKPILFDVPNDTMTYTIWSRQISGGNYFVTRVVNTNGGGSTNAVTNIVAGSGVITVTNGLNVTVATNGLPISTNLLTGTLPAVANGNAAALTNFNITNASAVFYVDPAGNDALAVKGNSSKPWLTIPAVVSNMTAGSTLVINPGIYNLANTNPMKPPKNCVVTAYGALVIQTNNVTTAFPAIPPIFVPSDNMQVWGGTWSNAPVYASGYNCCFGFRAGDAGATNWSVHDAILYGVSDVVFDNTASLQNGTLYDCKIYRAWDVMTHWTGCNTNSRLTAINCTVNSAATSVFSPVNPTFANNIGSAFIDVISCYDVYLPNGVDGNICASMGAVSTFSGQIRLINSTFVIALADSDSHMFISAAGPVWQDLGNPTPVFITYSGCKFLTGNSFASGIGGDAWFTSKSGPPIIDDDGYFPIISADSSPIVIASIQLTNQASTISTHLITEQIQSGSYLLTVNQYCSSAGSGGTLHTTASYTDDRDIVRTIPAAVDIVLTSTSATNSYSNYSVPIRIASAADANDANYNVDATFTSTVSGAAGSPKFNIYVTLQRLGD